MPTVRDDFATFHNPKSFFKMNLVFGSCYFPCEWLFSFQLKFQLIIFSIKQQTARIFFSSIFLASQEKKKGHTISNNNMWN